MSGNELFKFNESLWANECTREWVAEAIQWLGIKGANLDVAIQNCNTEIQKRKRIDPKTFGVSMERNLESFGRNFLWLSEEMKQSLPSVANVTPGSKSKSSENISSRVAQTDKKDIPNPLTAKNEGADEATAKLFGIPVGWQIKEAYNTLGSRGKQLDRLIKEAEGGR